MSLEKEKVSLNFSNTQIFGRLAHILQNYLFFSILILHRHIDTMQLFCVTNNGDIAENLIEKIALIPSILEIAFPPRGS